MNNTRQVYIFIGPPGAGKGSLSQLCVKRLGWGQLSTGNLCRKHISEQTSIGKEIDFAIKSGKLIPDSLMTSMVVEWLSSQNKNLEPVILDGFPRTLAQAQALHDVLNSDLKLDTMLNVIKLKVEDQTVVSRLSSRLICQNNDCQMVYSAGINSSLVSIKRDLCDSCTSPLVRRADDNEDAVKNRLVIYHKHAQDLVVFYKSVGMFAGDLVVEQPLENVFGQFMELIGSKKSL